MNNSYIKIFTKTNNGIQHVSPSEIVRLEAIGNYTRIYFSNHPPVIMAKILQKYEAMLLPYGFIRTHRSHLLNPLYIAGTYSNGFCIMKDSSELEISRRRKPAVLKALMRSGVFMQVA